MKLRFVVDYRTRWGQQLYLCGSSQELGKWNEEKAIKMQPASGERWEAEVIIKGSANFSYKYFLKEESGYVEWEFGDPRNAGVPGHFNEFHFRDFWRPNKAMENTLYTSPFAKSFFHRDRTEGVASIYESGSGYIRLQIRAPRVGKEYQMAVLGSSSALGKWSDASPILMSDEDFPVWKVDIPIGKKEVPFEYKYVIYSRKEQRVVTWETGNNRYFPLYELDNPGKLVVHSDEFFRYPVGNWKCAGVAIPVFSIRTGKSSGVGEFNDIKLLVDWSVKTGIKLIQVLPVNDTIATHTWTDSYPYAAISVEALHPVYANLESIGRLKDQKTRKWIDEEAKRLNALPEVDYEAVMKLKSRYFKQSFDENVAAFLKSKDFKEFFRKNESWLPDYAAYSYLRDQYKTPDFSKWGQYSSLSDEALKKLVDPSQKHYPDIAIHYYIQFHLDKQLREASAYARAHGVVLKGDIPIGIYRYSVDAWRLPHLFNMDSQAGAPPDDFSISGQNWGFPTYNWEEMAKDGFEWWKERMIKMSEYFDVFRIDHILGFFRIWEIPWEQVEGLLGRFNPALPFQRSELAEGGISFDYDRFCKPYIRTHMIHDLFGSHADMIFRQFLQEYAPGCYELKQEFTTQRQIKCYFDQLIAKAPESADFNNWVRYNLYRLLSEVLFMEAPLSNGQAFNPRIGFHTTYSFMELDRHTREKLDQLYLHYFYRRHNDFWRESAMKKLPMLRHATDMLICGEDLGMVPACVPGVMDELQILSLAIQRMPNDDRDFWHPKDVPYMSVTSTGSHDMSTLREWWQENRDQTQRFYGWILEHAGEAPFYCEPWIARDIINQHLHSPSMLAIFPIQDLVAMDSKLRRENPLEERINVPANSQHYWKYRFHLTMEELLKEEGFNGFLRQLVDQGGRSADY